MEVSKNLKAKTAGVCVGSASTSLAPTTQSTSIAPTEKKIETQAKPKPLGVSITGNSASAPLAPNAPGPSNSSNFSKISSGLNAPPSSNSGSAVNTGSAVSTGKKKTADLATNAIMPGSSSNFLPIPSSSSSTASVAPPASGSSGVTGVISNTDSTVASMLGPCQTTPQWSSTTAPGGTADLATPAPPTIPGSSGPGLPPLPPNWESQYIATYNSSSIYKTFAVDRRSPEFQTIVDMLSPYRVTTVEQIINPELWQSFAEKRKAMLRSKSDDLDLLKGLGLSSPVVARSAKLSEQFTNHRRLKTKYGEYSANEALLLHCTKDQANLEKIMAQGLDERVGGNGRLGRGLYFSDHPEKCVQYDKTGGTILIFGVLLGDCLPVDASSNGCSFVREPEKEAKQKRNKNDHFFDSITARGVAAGDYNEYVIFNRNQCYPFYIVKYQRGLRDYTDRSRGPMDLARKVAPTIAWIQLTKFGFSDGVPMPSTNGETWPFHAASIFKAMESGDPLVHKDHVAPTAVAKPTGTTTVDLTQASSDIGTFAIPDTTGDLTQANFNPGSFVGPVKRRRVADEECFICTNKFPAFSTRKRMWEQLKCSHRICRTCYQTIEVSRTTISGMLCESVRCPFCKGISGIEVGDCPDGVMTVSSLTSYCEGFEGHNSIKINYFVDSGPHKLNRTAYLPNSEEGKEILELLITAWDRKLTFMIGTSMTTGQQNVLVWNVHHKTSQTGGVEKYGYPDEGYFSRVRAELIAYGIE